MRPIPGAQRRLRHERDIDSFDRRAGSYERDWRSQFHAIVVARSAQVALDAVADPGVVLDVGCGTGALLRTLAERLPASVALCGVDPAPAMLETARAGLGGRWGVCLALASAEHLPFRDATFDLVVSTVSFDHWADQPAGLAEVARVLQPGGRLVLVDLFAVGWLRPIAAAWQRRDRMRTADELEAMLATARLRLVRWQRIFDLGLLPIVRAAIARPVN